MSLEREARQERKHVEAFYETLKEYVLIDYDEYKKILANGVYAVLADPDSSASFWEALGNYIEEAVKARTGYKDVNVWIARDEDRYPPAQHVVYASTKERIAGKEREIIVYSRQAFRYGVIEGENNFNKTVEQIIKEITDEVKAVKAELALMKR